MPSPARSSSSESIGFDWSELSRGELWAYYNALRGDPYPLDTLERFLEQPHEPLPCSREHLVVYRGTQIPVAALSVHQAFVARMQRFEQSVVEVALEVYGRKPTRIRHLGGYACRKSRTRSRRISEHALGNAIDVHAFDFGPAAKHAVVEGLPKTLRWAFQVQVARHWEAQATPTLALHARFLRLLTERVVNDRIFRIALGPGHRGHSNHFHFDMSPWRYVSL